MKLLFIIWAGLIPVVPLYGAGIYRQKEDKPKMRICYALFFMQLVMSILYIITYLKLR